MLLPSRPFLRQGMPLALYLWVGQCSRTPQATGHRCLCCSLLTRLRPPSAHPPPSALVSRYFALTTGANVVLLGSLVLAKGAALSTQVRAAGGGGGR